MNNLLVALIENVQQDSDTEVQIIKKKDIKKKDVFWFRLQEKEIMLNIELFQKDMVAKLKLMSEPIAQALSKFINLTLTNHQQIIIYSYSKRTLFLVSPRDYYYKYVYQKEPHKYGIVRKKVSDALFVGRAFHELLDTYYTCQKFNVLADEAYNVAVAQFHVKWTAQEKNVLSPKQGQLIENCLTWFAHYHFYYTNVVKDFSEIVDSETMLLSEIYQFEEWPQHQIKQHIRPDMIIQENGKYKLVEHKTFASKRTEFDRLNPQTFEYVAGVEKELGIKIHSVIFNEIRKTNPKGADVLKNGKMSLAKTSLTNLAILQLQKQLIQEQITQEEYNLAFPKINHDYYFQRVEQIIYPHALKQFLQEMKLSTKKLIHSIIQEQTAHAQNRLIDQAHYPINDLNSRKFPSEFQDIYVNIFQGMAPNDLQEFIDISYDVKEEVSLETINNQQKFQNLMLSFGRHLKKES